MYYDIEVPESLANEIMKGNRQVIVRRTDYYKTGDILRFVIPSHLNSRANIAHPIDDCRFKVEEMYTVDYLQILRFRKVTA